MVNSSETERNERMDTSSLMEQILSKDNLNTAYLQVVRNKGAEGVDGMKYTELKEHLAKNGEIIKEQLRTRKYKPQPVHRVEISKPDGGVRNLGVDQHIIIWHFRRIKLCRNNAGIFHPRTPGILVITVIEKIITVITRLKMGYFNFPDSANYGIK